MINKENQFQHTNSFKARELDKRMLEEPLFKPVQREMRRSVDHSPFKFQTTERMEQRKSMKKS